MLFWKDRLGLDLYLPTSAHRGGFCIPPSAGIPAGGRCQDEVAGARGVPRMRPDVPTSHQQALILGALHAPATSSRPSWGRPSTRSFSGHWAVFAHNVDEPEVQEQPPWVDGRPC